MKNAANRDTAQVEDPIREAMVRKVNNFLEEIKHHRKKFGRWPKEDKDRSSAGGMR